MASSSIPVSRYPIPGLTSVEAAKRLEQYGENAVSEPRQNLGVVLLSKFWAPVPWMLEITFLIELYLGKSIEAVVIGLLLVFNALLSFFQENRSHKALTLLRQKLIVQTRTRRDGNWQMIPSRELVPGDVIHLRMGDLVPADALLVDGLIELDNSSLTGETAEVEVGAGKSIFAGAVVKRGEATCEINSTGAHTR